LVCYPDPLSPRAYRDILDRLLQQTGVYPAVRIEGAQGKPLWGVNLRAVEYDGKLLVNLLNLSRETQDVRIVMKPAARPALNLLDGQEVEFPITLPALKTVLLALELGKD